MSSLVSQYMEDVAMRIEDAVTASCTFVHSFLISLHSNIQKSPFTRGMAASLTVLHVCTECVRDTDSIQKLCSNVKALHLRKTYFFVTVASRAVSRDLSGRSLPHFDDDP